MKIAKFFARAVLCLTAAALFLSALSCTPSGKEKEQSVSTSDAQTDPSDDPEAKSFTLMGCELSEYVIVYAESPYERIYSRRFSTEYDFFKLTAKDIQEKIEERTGVKLPVKSQSAEPVGHEIVVGPAKRDGCPDYSKLDIYESLCAAVGGRLFIGGGYDGREYSGGLKNTYCFASTYHAFDLIEEYLDGKDAVSDIEEGLELKKKNSFVTVACVGDSITEGVGSSDWEKSCHFSYPANLQRLLWKDHIIINYGSGGKTMRSDLTPYTATAQYSAARKYASKFDYILLMLGTNDYLQDAVWTESDNGSFSRSAKVIASGLCKKKNALTVIMNCPAYYGTVSGSPHVRSLQNGLPEYLNGQGINTSFFDMDGFSSKEIGRANYPDLLHPNDNGYYIMAGRLASLLDSLEKGEYTYVLPDYGDEESGKAPDVPLATGAISLLGEDLSKKHKIENGGYGSWNMAGAPYTLIDGSLFSGCKVTNVEFPVSACSKGDVLTVSVVKTDFPGIGETLSVCKLKADFSCGADWVKFSTDIDVPLGYTLAFGDKSDSMRILYYGGYTDDAHSFYSFTNVTTGAALAFNIYGVPGEDYGKGVINQHGVSPAGGSTLLTSSKVSDPHPDIALSYFTAWNHSDAPYFLSDASLFSGKTVTDIRLPVIASPADGVFTVTLLKVSGGRIVERGQSFSLKAASPVTLGWVMFSGLDIAVPDGWTLGFGATTDALLPAYVPGRLPGYDFYNSFGTYCDLGLVVEVYGK